MTVIAVTLVKDEQDIIEQTVSHMLTQVDEVIVADNDSSDETWDILVGLPEYRDRLILQPDSDPAYYQSRKMTALAAQAAKRGADWVVPFDADEYWYSLHGRIADVLEGVEASIVPAQMYDHRATAKDPDVGNPLERLGWHRREPLGLPKVACRAALPVLIEEGNHGASYREVTRADDLLAVRHFPYRSAEQMVRKVINGRAGRAATDLPKTVGAHWHEYGALLDTGGEEALHEVFYTWFYSQDPESDPALVFDPV